MRRPYLPPAEFQRLLALTKRASEQQFMLLRRDDPIEPFQIVRPDTGALLYGTDNLDAVADWLEG